MDGKGPPALGRYAVWMPSTVGSAAERWGALGSTTWFFGPFASLREAILGRVDAGLPYGPMRTGPAACQLVSQGERSRRARSSRISSTKRLMV
jgi:hypothetical protein